MVRDHCRWRLACTSTLSVVVPLYCEAPAVAALAEGMRSWLARERERRDVELVLVDDGSTDGTHDLLVEAFGDRARE